jgi:hypothetical protein
MNLLQDQSKIHKNHYQAPDVTSVVVRVKKVYILSVVFVPTKPVDKLRCLFLLLQGHGSDRALFERPSAIQIFHPSYVISFNFWILSSVMMNPCLPSRKSLYCCRCLATQHASG